MSKGKTKVIDGVEYYADRPDRCDVCYWWKNKRTGCILGEGQCYYLTRKIWSKREMKCEGCPYARGRACVSASCMSDLEAELREKRAAKNQTVVLEVKVVMEGE